MTSRNRQKNELLRALVGEARWTHHNFALAVNRVALEAGVVLHYDRTTVSHWLSGSRPRPPVPAFVAQALSRRTGRFVSVADTGLADCTANDLPSGCDGGSGATALLELVAADLDPARRAVLREQPFRVDWVVAPDWPGDPDRRRPGAPPAPGAADATVAAMAALNRAFTATHQAFGGGHARLALAAYLATDVRARLELHRGRERRGLLGATAALAHLIGLMCFDDLHHNLAQRYFRAALRLTAEAEDAAERAAVLCGMSAQAFFLGHHREAALLADTAAERAGGQAPPRARAALLGQAAVAHAALARRRDALARLAKAERCLDEVDGTRQPPGRTERADLAHHAGQALALLRDDPRAELALRRSLRLRPEGERRSRMLTTHQLTDLQLRHGRFEQACATWRKFLDDYPHIRSARVDRAFRAIHRQLREHRGNAAVHRASRPA
ncbi:hypothetical protein [Saccharothrix algeriensis]|uniref:Tetratricopeptide (TPR) repeat protein n=1 Tax=Saccharothrix algeriensis TaxID=173560 RepID=A0ABS2SHH9_9PSEU|nr:hypothetical protein [Saccharothrix algeriensis]MBM7814748.1 tetratricopeptide (TPR) repeat protein [Saccharothrix algeriensis]